MQVRCKCGKWGVHQPHRRELPAGRREGQADALEHHLDRLRLRQGNREQSPHYIVEVRSASRTKRVRCRRGTRGSRQHSRHRVQAGATPARGKVQTLQAIASGWLRNVHLSQLHSDVARPTEPPAGARATTGTCSRTALARACPTHLVGACRTRRRFWRRTCLRVCRLSKATHQLHRSSEPLLDRAAAAPSERRGNGSALGPPAGAGEVTREVIRRPTVAPA